MARILYIWKSEYPWDVRVEKVCSALKNAGNEVTILSRWGGALPEREESGGFKIIRAGYGGKRALYEPLSLNPYWKKAIMSAVDEVKPSLIIVREIMLAEAAAKAAQKNGIPIIMDMAENYPAAMKDWKKYRETFMRRLAVHTLNLPELAEKRSVAKMNGIITVCLEQNRRLNEKYGFPLEKMAVVHNTPPLSIFEGAGPPRAGTPIIFGHHGHMSAEKSVETLVRGFLSAAEKNDEIKLVLAGAGESYDDMRTIAVNSPFIDRINFMGAYLPEALPAILGSVDIGVIPYQVSDFNNFTIHNKIFDYFACGRPVIVSEAEPLKRIIEETGAGISVDCTKPEILAEAILNFHFSDYKQMSENAFRAAREKYNWETDSEALIKFVNKYL